MQPKSVNYIVLIGIFILMSAVAYGILQVLITKSDRNVGTSTEAPKALLTAEDIEGVLLISGVIKGQEDTSLNQTHFIDFDADGRPKLTKVRDLLPMSVFVDYKDVNNPDEFFVRTITIESIGGETADGIHKVSLGKMSTEYIKNANSQNVRNMTWSNEAELLAYHVQKIINTTGEGINANNFDIEIYSEESDSVIQTIPNALQPQWSPDGTQLLFFKADGLYLYNLASQEESRVVDLKNGELYSSSMMEISPDGTKLAWTSASIGKIVLFNIKSWKPFVIEDYLLVNNQGEKEYYWPVFSPDSRFLSVQSIDYNERLEERTNPQIEIKELTKGITLTTVPLDNLDFNKLFTDDWISKNDIVSQFIKKTSE